jgi:hypothetical protein
MRKNPVAMCLLSTKEEMAWRKMQRQISEQKEVIKVVGVALTLWRSSSSLQLGKSHGLCEFYY